MPENLIERTEHSSAEMALTLRPERTGLPFDICVSESAYVKGQRHRPRLKVFDRTKNTSSSVAIDGAVGILAGDSITGQSWKLLQEYITNNRIPLLALWNEEIDQVEYVRQHKPVEG